MRMKTALSLAIFCMSLCSFTSSSNITSAAGNIEVVVKGINEEQGQLGILLFKKKEGFPSDDKLAMKQALIPVTGKDIKYVFKNIPYGTYAVAVMHDANMNNELDTNFFGIPEEGFWGVQ